MSRVALHVTALSRSSFLMRSDRLRGLTGSVTLSHNSAEINSRALVWYDAPLVRRWPPKLIATSFVRVAEDPLGI